MDGQPARVIGRSVVVSNDAGEVVACGICYRVDPSPLGPVYSVACHGARVLASRRQLTVAPDGLALQPTGAK